MISVIIPTYNRAHTIKRSVESILNQTYSDLELIIVDDNSTDNTYDIVKSITDDRIKYIKLDENKGPSFARNTGIENSKGEYIAFQDSDDEWVFDKLEIQLKCLKDNNADFVFSSFNRYYKDTVMIIPDRDISNGTIFENLMYGNFIGTPTMFGKKECFDKEKFDLNLPSLEDWDLVIRISSNYKVHFINKVLVNVYNSDSGEMRNLKNGFNAIIYMILKYYDSFKNNKNILLIWCSLLRCYVSDINDLNTHALLVKLLSQ